MYVNSLDDSSTMMDSSSCRVLNISSAVFSVEEARVNLWQNVKYYLLKAIWTSQDVVERFRENSNV